MITTIACVLFVGCFVMFKIGMWFGEAEMYDEVKHLMDAYAEINQRLFDNAMKVLRP
jgi:hypothetical protein